MARGKRAGGKVPRVRGSGAAAVSELPAEGGGGLRGASILIRDRIFEFRRVPASDLRPHPLNAREHGDDQRAALQGILGQVGIADAAIVYWPEDGGSLMIIDGHLRQDVLEGLDVPCLVLDVSDAEAELLLAAIDPLAAMASTNALKFERLRAGLKVEAPALSSMLSKLAESIVEPDPTESAPPDAEDVPAAPAVPITQPGDLWTLGKHRLLCGDSTDGSDVSRCLAGCVPQLMVTDPPYGVEYDPGWRGEAGLGVSRTSYVKVTNDTRAAWAAAFAHFPGHVMYVWHGGLHAGDVATAIGVCGFAVRGQIVWIKKKIVISRGAYN